MTSDSEIHSGCITKKISGNWLSNGHLEVCILKLDAPKENHWKNDESRSGNLAIVTKLLQANTELEKSLLEKESPNKPVLVIAPELVFGSPDFESLNKLINQYPQNMIFICGFGFTKGGALIRLASQPNIEGIWRNLPNDNKKYNGGWVWVKNGSSAKCYIFLKNYFEQTNEITVPNLAVGDCIFRVEGEDLVIFPLICADLISKETNSPSKRVKESLNRDSSSNKRLLITGSLLNNNSSSGWWKTAIGAVLDAGKESNARLLLSNCKNPNPSQNEEEDKWRCLSGAYQHRDGCKPPQKPLPNLRYVADTEFSGLVVRNSQIGCVFGKLKWTNSPSEGLHVLSECSQYIWVQDRFEICDGKCDADELYRFVLRHKGKLFNNKITFNEKTKAQADFELGKLIIKLQHTSSSSLRNFAGNLFQKCLNGINKEDFCPDQLHEAASNLDCAITTLSLILYATETELMPDGKELEYGQLLSLDEQHEILVWDSPRYKAKELRNFAEEGIVRDGGSARPLTIIGRGNGGGSEPEEGRIRSNRLADISNASPITSDAITSVDKDICEANDRVVFWKNQGKIDDILSSTAPNQDLKEDLKREIGLP